MDAGNQVHSATLELQLVRAMPRFHGMVATCTNEGKKLHQNADFSAVALAEFSVFWLGECGLIEPAPLAATLENETMTTIQTARGISLSAGAVLNGWPMPTPSRLTFPGRGDFAEREGGKRRRMERKARLASKHSGLEG
jgi:hypothetical protein